MTAVGWFGLGSFGLPLALRALDLGHQVAPVKGHGRLGEFTAAGGSVGDPAPGGREIVALCLPDAPSVRSVLGEIDGAGWVVDFSSHDPSSARAFAADLAERGVGYLDCPVSGSAEMARTGGLTGYAGAADGDLPPVVAGFIGGLCRNVFWTGTAGGGQALKLVNQVVHIGNVLVLGEGLALAETLGVPLETAVAALEVSSGSSRMLERFGRPMAADAHPRQFSARLARKDLGSALGERPDLPVAALAHARLGQVIAAGYGEENFTRLGRVPASGEESTVQRVVDPSSREQETS